MKKWLISLMVSLAGVAAFASPALADEFETDPDTGEIIYQPDEGSVVDNSNIFGEVVEDVSEAETSLSADGDPDETSESVSETVSESESDPAADLETDPVGGSLLVGDFLGYAYIVPDTAEESEADSYAAVFSLSGISVPEDGVLCYDVTISGSSYTLVLPLQYQDSLQVIDGYLYNVGSSNVTGRLFTGAWSSSDYRISFYTLVPVLSTNYPNTAYTYGESGYVTVYTDPSYGSSRPASSSTYAACQVNKELTSRGIRFRSVYEYSMIMILGFVMILVFFLWFDHGRRTKT